MRTLRLKISDIFEFEGASPAADTSDVATIIPLVQKQFGFLPQPLVITIEGNEVVLQFPDESTAAQNEAARLAQKAVKRAAQGDYAKAIGIFKRVLELQPSLHSARRDLAMAYVETGDVENATNHLIEVLRLDSQDAWSWVVLANLYCREKSDPVTGEKFLRKALEIKPDDAWALNSLAALQQQRGQSEQAIELYEKAIAANPEFANAYLGEAMAYDAMKKTDEALGALERLFALGKIQDARTQVVFEGARQAYAKLQLDKARRDQSEAFKCVQNYKAELEVLSGFPVRIEEREFKDKVGARIQMAWTHGRDHHLIATRRGYAPELLAHLEAHELTHLKMESEARQAGKNLFFTTTATTQETAFRSVSGDLRRIQKEGYEEDSIIKLTRSLINGLCGFLFNCPLDMLIERHIRQNFPVLHSSQFLSLRFLANEAWQTNSNPEFRKITPKKIVQSSLAMNGAFCLALDALYQGASDFTAPYRSLDSFALSRKLHAHFVSASYQMGGGKEYRLVDEFADMLGLRDWYEWKPDPGYHQVNAPPPREGVTNPELLSGKHPAAVWYLLGALERYDKLPVEKVREIAFEIGTLGQSGIDYASPDKKYTLRTLPGETFSGLQLMCLMHAGFKRIAPELDSGIDLAEPFLTALELHHNGEGKE